MINIFMDHIPEVIVSITAGLAIVFLSYLIKKTKLLATALKKEKRQSEQIKPEMEIIKKQNGQENDNYVKNSVDFSSKTQETESTAGKPTGEKIIQAHPSGETYEKEKQTVFIIENDKDTVLHIYKYMINYYNIYYADYGPHALDKLKSIPKPDIILSGISGDNMDGYEFYHNLIHIEEYKDIPVFFLTGRPLQEDKLKAFKKGIIDYIQKPFDPEELTLKVKAFLNNRKVYKQALINKIEKRISDFLRKPGDDDFLVFEKKCSLYKISPREKMVLRELLKGRQTKEIAAGLFLSTHTIKKHIQSIFFKCGVQNRVELVNCFKE